MENPTKEDHFCDSSNVSYSLQMKDGIDPTKKEMNLKTNQQRFNSRSGSGSKYSIRLVRGNVRVDHTADPMSVERGEGMKINSVTFINSRQVTPGSCIRLLSHRNRTDLPADMGTERNIFTKTSEGFDCPLNIGKLNVDTTDEINDGAKSCAQAYDQPKIITRHAVPLLSDQTRPNFLHMRTENNTLVENIRDNSSNLGSLTFAALLRLPILS